MLRPPRGSRPRRVTCCATPAFSADLAAVDLTDEKLELAAELGADIVIDARAEDPAQVLQSHGGADVAIGLAVDARSFATAYAGLRRGGRLVLVALPASGALSVPVFDTVRRDVGNRVDSLPGPTWPRSSACRRGPDPADLRDQAAVRLNDPISRS